MDCPTCNSKNTKKLSMVYAQGTRTYNSKRSGSSVSSRGRVSLSSGSNRTTSQSALASAATPPQPIRFIKIIAGFLVVVLVTPLITELIFADDSVSILNKIMLFIFIVATSAVIYFSYKFLNKPYEKRKSDWHRAWICMRCAKVYDPTDSQS